jgi:hypothetical protein
MITKFATVANHRHSPPSSSLLYLYPFIKQSLSQHQSFSACIIIVPHLSVESSSSDDDSFATTSIERERRRSRSSTMDLVRWWCVDGRVSRRFLPTYVLFSNALTYVLSIDDIADFTFEPPNSEQPFFRAWQRLPCNYTTNNLKILSSTDHRKYIDGRTSSL